MSMGLLWLVYLLGRQFSGREEVGRMVLILLAIHPNGIAYAQLLSAEVPFLLLILAGFLLLNAVDENFRKLALAGILFGIATLVKSQGFFLPLVLGAAFLMSGVPKDRAERRRGWFRKLIIVYLFLGITLSPWLIRNYFEFDAFPVLVTNGSANLLVGNNPFANGKYKWDDQEIAWYEAQAPQTTGEVAEANKARTLAIQYIQKNPREALSRIPKKLWYTYAHDYEGLDWLRESCGGLSGWRHRLMQAFKAFGQILYLFILFYVLRSWLQGLRRRISKSANQQIHLLIYSSTNFLILYFSLIVMIIFGDGRFHFPLMPFLFLTAAVQLIPNNSQEPPAEQAQA
jgi:4-amino-4-deoxy-L-arabinose transferase-like glycosyltransferase